MRALVTTAALALAAPAAAQVAGGTTVLGLSAGIASPSGKASSGAAGGGTLGGQILHHPDGPWGYGIQVDRVEFGAKGGHDIDAMSVMAAARGNFMGLEARVMPYVSGAVGWAQTRADVGSGGTDRGSGPGLRLAFGAEWFAAPSLSAGLEARFERLAAGLPRLGLGGVTSFGFALRLNLWLGAAESPFPR